MHGRVQISIHTPLAGSDRLLVQLVLLGGHFNPHSPCGERPKDVRVELPDGKISIHTPLAGSDPIRRQQHPKRHISIHTPLAGSDCGVEPLWRVAYPISIHTPLAGSDVRTQVQSQHQKYFNPHSPCGERLEYQRKDMIHVYFNPHSPCGERHAARDSRFEQVISIHTPLAGSDDLAISKPLWWTQFQSTLPLRGATRPRLLHPKQNNFNPHSPCGERLFFAERTKGYLKFQSTLPLRGATMTMAEIMPYFNISIHTPLAGSDRSSRSMLRRM